MGYAFKDSRIISCVAQVDGRLCPSHPITFLVFGISVVHLFVCYVHIVPVAMVTHTYAIFGTSPLLPISRVMVPLLQLPSSTLWTFVILQGQMDEDLFFCNYFLLPKLCIPTYPLV